MNLDPQNFFLKRKRIQSSKKSYIKFLTIFASVAIFLLLSFTKTYAQTPTVGATRTFNILGTDATLGVARAINFPDNNVKDGSVISGTTNGPILSATPYDPLVIGVVARNAAIVISSPDTKDGIPVIADGQVYILVSSQQGNIKKGDLLTTSTIPGVAVKALQSGYILGSALEDYSNSDTSKVETIAAELNLHYYNSKPVFPGSLSDIFKIALLSVKSGPSSIFKYIVAAIVVLGSFVLGFLTSGRTAAKGVEALGRNPAAKGIIYLGIIFNVSIVIAIVLAGLIVAFFILRL